MRRNYIRRIIPPFIVLVAAGIFLLLSLVLRASYYNVVSYLLSLLAITWFLIVTLKKPL